jgi:hypothetical protein
MCPDDLNADLGNNHAGDHDHDHDHDHEDHDAADELDDVEGALEEALELDTQSQLLLEMRRQNLDLLRLATEVAGYSGQHGPLKPGDTKHALRSIWDVFSEFYTWIDPEDVEDDDEGDDE